MRQVKTFNNRIGEGMSIDIENAPPEIKAEYERIKKEDEKQTKEIEKELEGLDAELDRLTNSTQFRFNDLDKLKADTSNKIGGYDFQLEPNTFYKLKKFNALDVEGVTFRTDENGKILTWDSETPTFPITPPE
jgi:hypothetical protein